jgi:hypothetical protein
VIYVTGTKVKYVKSENNFSAIHFEECNGNVCNVIPIEFFFVGYVEFRSWGSWSSCSKKCGGGKQSRARTCSSTTVPCSGDTKEDQDCNKQTCPIAAIPIAKSGAFKHITFVMN